MKEPKAPFRKGAKMRIAYEMIIARGGATSTDIIRETGWLPHTLRARISDIGTKYKLTIERERILGVTIYRATHSEGKMLNWP